LLTFLLPFLLTATAHAQVASGPWVQQVSESQAWILWEGDPAGVVEWGPLSGLGRQTTVTEASGEIQQAQLLQLEPNTRYHYRVRHGEGTTDTFSFRTARAGSETSFSFVVISDTQHDSANPDKLRETLEQGVVPWSLEDAGVEDIDQAIDLVLVVGDLVNDGWDEDQWRDEFIGPAQALMASVPFYAAIGNHEANSPSYFDRFRLPANGSEDYLEHWWYLDRANARIIGLDSNAPYTGETQQGWLHGVLGDACEDETIDMVFVALHHPWKSELWPPGESDFTGEIIASLDSFAADCGKPVAHFFGHTHGYSRGQSRDAPHAWVNVATASGNIDYWGEYDQRDYEEFTTSQDEYGFVVVDVQAGDDPAFRIRRIGRGDEHDSTDNEERDFVWVPRHGTAPATPEARSPAAEVPPWCVQLAASPFCDPEGDRHGAAQWQVATSCDAFDAPAWERWVQHEDWYEDVDLQQGDDLGDVLIEGLEPQRAYCWRVRYRDRGLTWSAWSQPTAFETGRSELSDNLLSNPGAEQGVDGWQAVEGPVEALGAGDCDGGEPFAGQAYLAVGGVCEPGVDHGEAVQVVAIDAWAKLADAGTLAVLFGGWTSSYSGSDLAEIELRWLDADGAELGRSARIGEPSASWVQLRAIEAVPAGTRSVAFVLLGTRNAGADCDAYFDELELRIDDAGILTPCLEPPAYPWDEEVLDCADTGLDDTLPEDSGQEGRRCGCAAGTRPAGWVALLLGLLGICRRTR
jgi:hypothetical protein